MPFTPRTISPAFDYLPLCDDEKALLRGCLETPWDDAPFLVYSDWVEEHGEEERAEFIRYQVRGAVNPSDNFGSSNETAIKWVDEKIRLRGGWEFFRGLPSYFSMGRLDYPIQGGGDWINNRQDWLFEGIDWDWCFGIGIDWIKMTLMHDFFYNPKLCNLTHLDINKMDEYDEAGPFVIAHAEHFQNLTHLTLSNTKFDSDAMFRFALNPIYSNLSSLVLVKNAINDDCIREFCQCRHMKGLAYLNLSDNPISNVGAKYLASSENFPNLKSLTITNTNMSHQGKQILSQSKFLRDCKIVFS